MVKIPEYWKEFSFGFDSPSNETIGTLTFTKDSNRSLSLENWDSTNHGDKKEIKHLPQDISSKLQPQKWIKISVKHNYGTLTVVIDNAEPLTFDKVDTSQFHYIYGYVKGGHYIDVGFNCRDVSPRSTPVPKLDEENIDEPKSGGSGAIAGIIIFIIILVGALVGGVFWYRKKKKETQTDPLEGFLEIVTCGRVETNPLEGLFERVTCGRVEATGDSEGKEEHDWFITKKSKSNESHQQRAGATKESTLGLLSDTGRDADPSTFTSKLFDSSDNVQDTSDNMNRQNNDKPQPEEEKMVSNEMLFEEGTEGMSFSKDTSSDKTESQNITVEKSSSVIEKAGKLVRDESVSDTLVPSTFNDKESKKYEIKMKQTTQNKGDPHPGVQSEESAISEDTASDTEEEIEAPENTVETKFPTLGKETQEDSDESVASTPVPQYSASDGVRSEDEGMDKKEHKPSTREESSPHDQDVTGATPEQSSSVIENAGKLERDESVSDTLAPSTLVGDVESKHGEDKMKQTSQNKCDPHPGVQSEESAISEDTGSDTQEKTEAPENTAEIKSPTLGKETQEESNESVTGISVLQNLDSDGVGSREGSSPHNQDETGATPEKQNQQNSDDSAKQNVKLDKVEGDVGNENDEVHESAVNGQEESQSTQPQNVEGTESKHDDNRKTETGGVDTVLKVNINNATAGYAVHNTDSAGDAIKSDTSSLKKDSSKGITHGKETIDTTVDSLNSESEISGKKLNFSSEKLNEGQSNESLLNAIESQIIPNENTNANERTNANEQSVQESQVDTANKSHNETKLGQINYQDQSVDISTKDKCTTNDENIGVDEKITVKKCIEAQGVKDTSLPDRLNQIENEKDVKENIDKGGSSQQEISKNTCDRENKDSGETSISDEHTKDTESAESPYHSANEDGPP